MPGTGADGVGGVRAAGPLDPATLLLIIVSIGLRELQWHLMHVFGSVLCVLWVLSDLWMFASVSALFERTPDEGGLRSKKIFSRMPGGRPFCIAHRCAAGEAPENTIAAALYCQEKGVRWLQVDCMLTRDKKVAVIHDMEQEKNLSRLCGMPKGTQVIDLALHDIPKLKPRIPAPDLCDPGLEIDTKRFGAEGQRVCELNEFFSAVGPEMGVLLELWMADEILVKLVAQLVRKHKRVHSTVVGNPFSRSTAVYLDRHAPDIPRIFYARELMVLFSLYHLGLLPLAHCVIGLWDNQKRVLNLPVVTKRMKRAVGKLASSSLLPRMLVGVLLSVLSRFFFAPRMIAYVQAQGVPVFAWILNDAEDLAEGQRLGADGLMTDYVERWLKFS